jgi:hypothetical protein
MILSRLTAVTRFAQLSSMINTENNRPKSKGSLGVNFILRGINEPKKIIANRSPL